MIAQPRLVFCAQHRESCCWVQLDGSHVSTRACTCFEESKLPFQCPIDAHSLPWLLANPEWTEEPS